MFEDVLEFRFSEGLNSKDIVQLPKLVEATGPGRWFGGQFFSKCCTKKLAVAELRGFP